MNRNFDLPFIGFQGTGGPDNGLLPTDRTHVFKAAGAYEIPWSGSNSTEISAFTTFQSGTPLTTRFTLFGVAGQILYGRGDLGRTEMYSETSLGVRHRYRFGRDNRFALVATLDILNLFNEKNVLGVNETFSETAIEPEDLGYEAGCDDCDPPIDPTPPVVYEGEYQRRNSADIITGLLAPNEFLLYNKANAFQGPRQVRFGFRLQF